MTTFGGDSVIRRTDFLENVSTTRGGGFNASQTLHATTFIECSFIGNENDGRGGAYYGAGSPRFENCLFIDNKAAIYGGVAYLHEGSPVFINCTAFRNRARMGAGGIITHGDGPTPTITNCVLWGNRSIVNEEDTEENQLVLLNGQINFSCVEGWTGEFGGVGNFGDDPRFIDPERGNLRLREDSPCYDAGDDTAVTQKVDLDGHPRILGDRVDLGSYELLCPAILSLKASCTTGGKLKAVVRTTLPEGATVRVRQGEGKSREATVKPNGKAVAKWRPDETDTGSICPEGCTDPLCAEPPCPYPPCAEPPCP